MRNVDAQLYGLLFCEVIFGLEFTQEKIEPDLLLFKERPELLIKLMPQLASMGMDETAQMQCLSHLTTFFASETCRVCSLDFVPFLYKILMKRRGIKGSEEVEKRVEDYRISPCWQDTVGEENPLRALLVGTPYEDSKKIKDPRMKREKEILLQFMDRNSRYNHKADSFSFGMALFNFLIGEQPGSLNGGELRNQQQEMRLFQAKVEALKEAQNPREFKSALEALFAGTSLEAPTHPRLILAKSLIERTWELDPMKRPSMAEILEDPFFQEVIHS